MGLTSWIKGLFNPVEIEEFSIDDYNYYCPLCGSSNLGYSSIISNLGQVIQDDVNPEYEYRVHCLDCGFTSVSDDTITNLKQLKMEKKC